jgi:hypothetical protein
VSAVYASSGTSWQSIIYNFTSPTTSNWTLPYIPPVFPPDPKPKIDIEKYTNNENADSAPAPSITVGQSVTWKYIITNTGNFELKNIVVTDDKLGQIGIITSLAVGKSQTFYAYGTT